MIFGWQRNKDSTSGVPQIFMRLHNFEVFLEGTDFILWGWGIFPTLKYFFLPEHLELLSLPGQALTYARIKNICIYIRYTLNCQNVAFMRFYEMVVQDKSCRIECCFLERILVSFERSMNNFAPIEKFLECMHNLQANRQMRWAVFKNYPAKNIFSSTT